MNVKRKNNKKKTKKICFTIYAISRTFLFFVLSSRQVDRMNDDDDDEGEKKREQNKASVYMYVQKVT